MTEILGQFREDELPPSVVDLERAVRVGRRRRRTQTGVVAASVVAALTLGAATAPRWLGSLPGPGTVSPAATLTCEGGAPLPSQAPADPAAPAYLDVLRRWVDVSGVNGFRLSRYTTARHYHLAELTTPTGDQTVEVTLYASDGEPHYRTTSGPPERLDPTTGMPTDPIGGQPAYWLPDQQFTGMHTAAGVAWQWAPGAWVFVTAANTERVEGAATPSSGPLSDVDRTALRGLATQAAAELQLGPGTPVVAPFATPVPDCTRLLGTSLMYGTKADGTPFSRFDLGFASDGVLESTNPLLFPGSGEPWVTVTATSGATPDDKPGSATQNVDGHPAAHIGGLLVVYGVDGFAFEIQAPGDFDAAVSLFRSVSVYPGAEQDESTWSQPVEP